MGPPTHEVSERQSFVLPKLNSLQRRRPRLGIASTRACIAAPPYWGTLDPFEYVESETWARILSVLVSESMTITWGIHNSSTRSGVVLRAFLLEFFSMVNRGSIDAMCESVCVFSRFYGRSLAGWLRGASPCNPGP